MYIQPNSNVFIFHNVPFCESYEDTMDFSSASQQWTYLADHYLKYSFNHYTYQRATRNSIKVEKTCDDLYDCNYMAFVNVSYGNKVFYCFIKEVKYINDNVTEIVYEIDPLQTWMFDYSVGSCFIEREHAPSDSIGQNLVPENLDTGDYMDEAVYNGNNTAFRTCEFTEDKIIVLFCTCDENYSDSMGNWNANQGIFNGLYPIFKIPYNWIDHPTPQTDDWYFDYNATGAGYCLMWLDALPASMINAVKMAVVMPKNIVVPPINNPQQTVKINSTMLRVDGITPVYNNKCLCYPYNFLYVSNNQGKTAEYHYEYFESNNDIITFRVYGDTTPNPSIALAPLNYKKFSINTDEMIQLGNFPQISFNVDSFKAWLAQSASTFATSALTMAYVNQNITAGNSPNVGASVLKYGGIHGVIGGIVGGSMATVQPPQNKGSQSGALNIVANIQNFTFINKRIRPEYATIIDDYFQMYGYACHQVKVPNTKSRVKWNYIKTVGCVITGSLPADEANRIKEMYDKGVRFWHYGATMYDYDTANNVVI